jgi:hypothetical protein
MSQDSHVKMFALAAAIGLGAIAATATAASIGVKFAETGDGDTFPTFTGTAGVTVANGGSGNYAQSNWNNVVGEEGLKGVSASNIALVDSTGAASPITFGYTSAHYFNATKTNEGGTGPASPTADQELVSGALENDEGTPATATFSNVSPGSYTLVAYTVFQAATASGAYSGAATFTVNGSDSTVVLDQGGNYGLPDSFDGTTGAGPTAWMTNPNPSSTSAPSNYVAFTNVSPDANGNITLAWSKYTGGAFANDSTGNGVDAIQLIPAVTPEPASLGLLGLGVLSLPLIASGRRRHMRVSSQ